MPPSTSSPLPCVNFTMDSEGVRCRYRTLAIVLDPWSNRDAVTNAAILDLQLTAFWRHLCGDAFRRQSRISDLLRSAVAGIHRRLSTVEISESLSRMSLDRRFPSVGFCTKGELPAHRKEWARALRQVALWVYLLVALLVSRGDHRQWAGSDVGFGSAARVNRHRNRPVLLPIVQDWCAHSNVRNEA